MRLVFFNVRLFEYCSEKTQRKSQRDVGESGTNIGKESWKIREVIDTIKCLKEAKMEITTLSLTIRRRVYEIEIVRIGLGRLLADYAFNIDRSESVSESK